MRQRNRQGAGNIYMKRFYRILVVALIAAMCVTCVPAPECVHALAPASRHGDLAGIEHKDIAQIEGWLEMCFARYASSGLFSVKPGEDRRDIVARKLEQLTVDIPPDSVFTPPGAAIYIHEVTMTAGGYYRVLIRKEDDRNGIREYFAEFSSPQDLVVYPRGATRFISDPDRAAIRRYRETGERVIDTWIGGMIRRGLFTEIDGRAVSLGWPEKFAHGRLVSPDRYLPESFLRMMGRELDPFLALFGLTVEKALQGKNIVFIAVPDGLPLPVIAERGADGVERRVAVSSHASANAVYFFVRAGNLQLASIDTFVRNKNRYKLATALCSLRENERLKERFIHEIGALCGLPYWVAAPAEGRAAAARPAGSGTVRNALDDAYTAYRSILRVHRFRSTIAREETALAAFTASPVDLDTALPGRDYAGSADDPYARDPTTMGDIRRTLGAFHELLSRFETDPRNAHDPAAQRLARKGTIKQIGEILGRDDDTLVTEITSRTAAWESIRNDILAENDIRISGMLLQDALGRIHDEATTLARYRLDGIPVSRVLPRSYDPDLKVLGRIELAFRDALARGFSLEGGKPFGFYRQLRAMAPANSEGLGSFDFSRTVRADRDTYLVPFFRGGRRASSPDYFAVIAYARSSGIFFARSRDPRFLVYTAREVADIRATIGAQGRPARLADFLRDPEDTRIINAYIDHEETVDRLIEEAMRSPDRHHTVYEKDAITALIDLERDMVEMFTSDRGFGAPGTEERFQTAVAPRNHAYMLIDAGEALPLFAFAPEGGPSRDVVVRSHTGARQTTYLFFTHDEYIALTAELAGEQAVPGAGARSLLRYRRHIAHEAGVRLGLPAIVMPDGAIENEFDRAYGEWVRNGRILIPSRYPSLRVMAHLPFPDHAREDVYLAVDPDRLRGVNAAGEPYERDLASAESAPAGTVREIDRAVLDAEAAERAIFAPKNDRYVLIAPTSFFAGGEFEAERKAFHERFDLRSADGRTSAEFIGRAIGAAGADAKKAVIIVPAGTPRDQLERLIAAGMRFVVVDAGAMADARLADADGRLRFHFTTYAIMLLVRHIDPDTPPDSPLVRLLDFYLRTHSNLTDAAARGAYIEAVGKSDATSLGVLVNGILSFRPVERYDIPNYDRIARAILTSA